VSPSTTACGSATDGGLAGVDADPGAEVGDAPGGLHLLGIGPNDVQDAEPGARGALGVVLVGGGDAEERGDPVAHVGVHRPAELLHRAAHAADALADHDFHLGRRQPFAEARRAHDVGEERRHRSKLVLG
jgi:hypothetical protein